MSEPPSPPPPPQYGPMPGSYPPPPMPYGGYPPPVPYGGMPQGPKNGLGIAALVLAIVGVVLCWTVAGGVILGLCAIIIGFVARGRVKRGEANNGGVAIAGIALGVVALVAALVFIPIYVGLFDQVGGTDYIDCLSDAGSDPDAAQRCADEFTQRVEDRFSVTMTPTP